VLAAGRPEAVSYLWLAAALQHNGDRVDLVKQMHHGEMLGIGDGHGGQLGTQQHHTLPW
jgi:hypothetical protein